MDKSERSNVAKGRDSYDSNFDGTMVPFFNRNVTPYATEAGGPKFDLVPITKQKDIMLNVARLHAQQEYDRIVDLVRVLEGQAQQIKRRLEVTDMVHAAVYDFQTYHGNTYWLLYDKRKDCTRLSINGPTDWATGIPEHYEYITQVKWLGDHTWTEIDKE